MSDDTPSRVGIGLDVYTEDGEHLGTIRGFDEDGFFVTTRDGIEALSVEHEHAGGTYGEAELMWRCSNCGELGDIDTIPEACPSCGASKEHIYYWIED